MSFRVVEFSFSGVVVDGLSGCDSFADVTASWEGDCPLFVLALLAVVFVFVSGSFCREYFLGDL